MSKPDGNPEYDRDKIKRIRRARGGRQYNAQRAGAHEVKKRAIVNKYREKELDHEIDEYLDEIELEICPITNEPHNFSNLFPYRCLDCKMIGPEPNGDSADLDNLNVILDEDLMEK